MFVNDNKMIGGKSRRHIAFFGSYAAGAVVDAYGWPDSWFIFAGYALVVAVVFAVVFKYRHNPAEMEGVKH